MANSEGTGEEKKEVQPVQPVNNENQIAPTQENSKDEKKGLEIAKGEVELEFLKIKKEKLKCFSWLLIILVKAFSVALIGGGFLVFCSIKGACDSTANWMRLIFGSVMAVSFVVLIIVLSQSIKKLVADSDEE